MLIKTCITYSFFCGTQNKVSQWWVSIIWTWEFSAFLSHSPASDWSCLNQKYEGRERMCKFGFKSVLRCWIRSLCPFFPISLLLFPSFSISCISKADALPSISTGKSDSSQTLLNRNSTFHGVLAQWWLVDWSNYLHRFWALTIELERKTKSCQLSLKASGLFCWALFLHKHSLSVPVRCFRCAAIPVKAKNRSLSLSLSPCQATVLFFPVSSS